MELSINIKSGTGGYADYDGCDMIIKRITSANLYVPRIGETIKIFTDCKTCADNLAPTVIEYKVIDVVYDIYSENCDVIVYVVPIGRSI